MANATATVSGAAKTGITGTTVLTATKAAVLSPLFGAAVSGGIIAFEWWKGSKDAQKFTTVECCQDDAAE